MGGVSHRSGDSGKHDGRGPPLNIVLCGSAGAGKTAILARLLDAAGDPRQRRPAARALVAVDPHGSSMLDVALGAAVADVAVVVVDARIGIDDEARRHLHLASALRVGAVVLAVNKLDLVGQSREAFERIEADFREFAAKTGLAGAAAIPVSARSGANVGSPGDDLRWYAGPTLRGHLDGTPIEEHARGRAFRMAVEEVGRGDAAPRSFSGRVLGGAVRPGERLRVLPSGHDATVARITSAGADLAVAVAGQTVALTFDREVGVSPGDLVASAASPPGIADQFEATIVWTGDEEMFAGRPYLLKTGAGTVGVAMAAPKYKVNVATLEHLAAKTLHKGDLGVCNMNLDAPIVFDPHAENRETGGFAVIDRSTGKTVGLGALHFALRRSQNIHWQAIEVNKDAHAALKGQRPCVVWFTGLSGAGKSAIANLVEKKLHARGRHTYLLDGDNVRHGLNKDLGFTEADRVENIRRIAEVARLMADAGLIVLVAFISPFRAERRMARALVARDEFCEVHVDTPLAVAEQRDTKGLYKKARRGELKNFTGIDSPYEAPEHPEIRLDTTRQTPEEAADSIVARLEAMGALARP